MQTDSHKRPHPDTNSTDNAKRSNIDMSVQVAKARAMLEERKRQLALNQNNAAASNNTTNSNGININTNTPNINEQNLASYLLPQKQQHTAVPQQQQQPPASQLMRSFVPASTTFTSDIASTQQQQQQFVQQQQPLQQPHNTFAQPTHLHKHTTSTQQSKPVQSPVQTHQYLPVKLSKPIGLKFKNTVNNKQHSKSTVNTAFSNAIDTDEPATKQRPIDLLNIDDDNDDIKLPVANNTEQTNGHIGNGTDTTMTDNTAVDPLDAYMTDLQHNSQNERYVSTLNQRDTELDHMDTDEQYINSNVSVKSEPTTNGIKLDHTNNKSHQHNNNNTKSNYERETFFNDDDAVISEDELDLIDDGVDRSDSKYKNAVKQVKGLNLERIDHSTIDYTPVRKNFYIEDKLITDMTDDEVALYRLNELEGVKIRGNNVVRPVKTWLQCGLSEPVYNIIHNIDQFSDPFPIQAQAIPVLMSGRDCIAVAKTGSGKSLAFTLPLIRHVADQPALQPGDGPIALVIVPTRELCTQLYYEIRKYSKPHNLKIVAVYGGTGIGQNINSIKQGCHILVATPGRLIDIFNTNNGRLISLQRITYVVLDEADRMFDMGFAPQIELIIQNIRPDRQTVMFSATFPRIVESVARKILNDPIEIIIGGRSIISNNITQLVEVMSDKQHKIKRLLQLLSEYNAVGQILIFVDRQDTVDELYQQLLLYGYSSVTVHGAMDQIDRDNAIIDFKQGTKTICIATSIIARGLDVKNLCLVINYECPKHIEDYIHRIGRTGRGSNKGTAITFVMQNEAKYAAQLGAVLNASKQTVSDELLALSKTYKGTINKQLLLTSGYGGRGFKFNADEKNKGAENTKQKQQLLLEADTDNADNSIDDTIVDTDKNKLDDKSLDALEQLKREAEQNQQPESTNEVMRPDGSYAPIVEPVSKPKEVKPAVDSIAAQIAAAKKAAEQLKQNVGTAGANTAVTAFALKAAMINAAPTAGGKIYSANHHMSKKNTVSTEIVINDYSQTVRWRLVSKGATDDIADQFGVGISIRGVYVPPGKSAPNNERPLYMQIEGADEQSINAAKREILREIESANTIASSVPQSTGRGGKYNVLGPAQRETQRRLQ